MLEESYAVLHIGLKGLRIQCILCTSSTRDAFEASRIQLSTLHTTVIPCRIRHLRLQDSVQPLSEPVQDGDETDVDCGGSSCPPCPSRSNCLVDTDCLYDNCPEPTRATDNRVCIALAKSCPNDCGGSSRGTCEYTSSVSGASLNFTECSADSSIATCRASCACHGEYGGDGCQYTEEQLYTAKKIRQSSLEFVQASGEGMDVTQETIARQATLLAKVVGGGNIYLVTSSLRDYHTICLILNIGLLDEREHGYALL